MEDYVHQDIYYRCMHHTYYLLMLDLMNKFSRLAGRYARTLHQAVAECTLSLPHRQAQTTSFQS